MGQLLTAIKLETSLIRLQADQDPRLLARTGAIDGLLAKAIHVVRHVASDLRPAALDLGLVPAIEWLIEDFVERYFIESRFDVLNEDINLDDTRATAVFRVVQESLTNVARHADASEVAVVLRQKDGQLSLSICDNGGGFDSALIRAQPGFGLMGMRERMLALGGTLHIDSRPGAGTTVVIQLPMEGNAP